MNEDLKKGDIILAPLSYSDLVADENLRKRADQILPQALAI